MNIGKEWVDPDDAPEWTAKDFDSADYYIGKKLVRRGRPKSEQPKQSITIRLDRDVVERFRETGPGWQGRINQALRKMLDI